MGRLTRRPRWWRSLRWRRCSSCGRDRCNAGSLSLWERVRVRAAALSRTERFWALLLALVWDLSLGEPPEAAPPVVWMGRAIDAADRRAPEEERPRLAYGALVALALPLIAAAVTRTALAVTRPPLLRLALTAYLLKSSLSVRGLLDAARRVQASLEADDPAGARDAP